MKELPGNPYDPCVAARSDSPLSDEYLNEWMSVEGITAETAIFCGLDRLTHAMMALAYEQRTANLIGLADLGYGPEARTAMRRMGMEA